MRKIMFLMALAALLVFTVAPARAVTYNFSQWISGTPVQTAGNKIFMDVTQETIGGFTGVKFNFRNEAVSFTTSSITEIGLYDGTYFKPSSGDPVVLEWGSGNGISNNTGITLFGAPDVAPPIANIPGQNAWFQGEATIFAGSGTAGNPANGINPGESYYFVLRQFSGNFNDVITALDNVVGQGPFSETNPFNGLAAVIHVQSLPNSNTYVNNTVPLPGAVLLLGAGLVRLVAYARRRED